MPYMYMQRVPRVAVSAVGEAVDQGGWLAPFSPAQAGRQGRDDDGGGKRPSDDLRRTLDGIMSGETKMDYYPSAKEYLEHLDAVLDE